jgi:hypothetical protein
MDKLDLILQKLDALGDRVDARLDMLDRRVADLAMEQRRTRAGVDGVETIVSRVYELLTSRVQEHERRLEKLEA